MIINNVLKEILHFWEIFKTHCLSSSSLCSDCKRCTQSLKDKYDSIIKQLKYVRLKENTIYTNKIMNTLHWEKIQVKIVYKHNAKSCCEEK